MEPITVKAYELSFLLFQLATKLAQLQRSASVSLSKSFSFLSTCQFEKVVLILDNVSICVGLFILFDVSFSVNHFHFE